MHLERIRQLQLPNIEQRYDERDTILYALGLGYGADPLNESELPFVYEARLKAVPSMCCTLCHPGFWLKDPAYGVDWMKILHAEQFFEIHAPIPSKGVLRGEYSVSAVEDKGRDKGALLHLRKSLHEVASGRAVATVRSTLFLRGDGGQGGFGEPVPASPPLPERAPDKVVDIPTLERAALIYRLSGDWNPLHIDPAVARKAGFERPILHGLCTAGIACRAILASFTENEPERLRSLFVRFSNPVYPGETVRLEFHVDSEEIRFRALVPSRGVVVLDRGRARLNK